MSSYDKKFHEKTKNEEPRALAKKLMEVLAKPSRIIDLGAGAGVDAKHFIENGHTVIAVDRETTVLEDLKIELSNKNINGLEVVKADLYEMKLPQVDCVYASFSLPFCPTQLFEQRWHQLEAQIPNGATIAMIFFGKNDSWAEWTERFTFHSKSEIETLFKAYDLLHLEELENDGTSMRPNGEIVTKHWHTFSVIGRKKSII